MRPVIPPQPDCELLNFIVEEEHEGCLAFLDVLIKRQENDAI